jgi:hypothetical protein
MLEPSTLMGLTERTAGLCVRGVPTLLPKSDVGVGYNSIAFNVGDNGVGKPGYLRLTSVKSDKLGRGVFESGTAVGTQPMLNAGCLWL